MATSLYDNGVLLRSLVDLRDRTVQKSRVAFSNRLFAIQNNTDTVPSQGIAEINRWLLRFIELEQEATHDIEVFAKEYPIIDVMIQVKGVGFTTAAKVASLIDIERAPTVSALWRYAGYAVIDGKAERRVAHEKSHYNGRLRTNCYVVGGQFLKAHSPYADLYYEAKEKYQSERDWDKLHIHLASMRKMIKVWLSHLWMCWREMEGLPTPNLYVMEHMGHTHLLKPQDYGWPDMKTWRKEDK